MEFLTTPDLHAVRPGTTPARATPRATPLPPGPDRAGIKSSFQALFSPAVPAPTPSLFPRGPAPGLTPFLNGLATPSLVPPSSGLLPFQGPTPHLRTPRPAGSPDALSSPFLQAAAKEAVRREFMNMPTYVSPTAPPPGERVVPARDFGSRTPASHSPAHPPEKEPRPAAVPSPGQHPATPTHVSPSSGDAKVPSSTAAQPPAQLPPRTSQATSPDQVPAPDAAPKDDAPQQPSQPSHASPGPLQQPGVPPPVQPQYFMHAPPPPPAPGMVVIGQHGQMMMAPPPPGAVYAPPPGMVMFAGGQPPFAQPGMMVPPPHGGPMMRTPGQVVKPETQAERKDRIEREKQELVREFKKKTREAALVRFRQKRRERRFGKLIRYDCRKKLADARPRVKGRFVRIKDDEEESEGIQVVPNLQNER